MPISDAFVPVISSGAQTCVQVTTGATALKTPMVGNEVLIKCLTNPAYIKLGREDSSAVSATNGYYMAVGDEVRWQISNQASELQYIRSGGSDGALSIAYGTGS